MAFSSLLTLPVTAQGRGRSFALGDNGDGQTLTLARSVFDALLRAPLPAPEAECRQALASAVLTPDGALDAAQRAWFSVLRA